MPRKVFQYTLLLYYDGRWHSISSSTKLCEFIQFSFLQRSITFDFKYLHQQSLMNSISFIYLNDPWNSLLLLPTFSSIHNPNKSCRHLISVFMIFIQSSRGNLRTFKKLCPDPPHLRLVQKALQIYSDKIWNSWEGIVVFLAVAYWW